MKLRKKLIEVALPLEAINAASAREKSIRHGHPSTLHLWWARRPLAAARAVIFAQMVDDPSSVPEEFPTEEAQEAERQRLFGLIEELVPWESTNNEVILERARQEIWRSWRRACADNRDHPQAAELFNPEKLPGFHDPFAGGGALPLEAQRLGLNAYASDLNPVAVLINKAMIEIPPKFAGQAPVNPESRKDKRLVERVWKGAEGLAEDVRYYGKWMRDEAHKRIGHLYPAVEITEEMAREREDLRPLVGQKLTVIAWLWARTVKSPNPAFAHVDVPLTASFWLGEKPGKEAYIHPVIESGSYSFCVKVGKSIEPELTKRGTKAGSSGSSFLCLMSGTPIPFEYLRDEAKRGRMGARLMAIVCEGTRSRVYLSPTREAEELATKAFAENPPEASLPEKALGFRVQEYGVSKWKELFSSRQLVGMSTLSDLILGAHDVIKHEASLTLAPTEAASYADAVVTYLAFAVDRLANYCSTICTWHSGVKYETVTSTFGRHTLPMTWDFAEANPMSQASGNWLGGISWIANALQGLPAGPNGIANQSDAAVQSYSIGRLVSTDPPYYDNIGYADLSDFFYVWLRRSLMPIYPQLFSTVAVPKVEELVATPYRHGGRENAEAFFLRGMTSSMERLARQAHPVVPVTIYYAFKQSEKDSDRGVVSTGWDTFLDAVLRAGFSISGTWPMRTELTGNLKKQVSALASSIVLVCRPREPKAPTATRREFLAQLKRELPAALDHLREGNIALVDLQQASIGPGMDVFTRYSKVIDSSGQPMSVRDALIAINQTLDELVAEREGELDRETQWALAWFDHSGFTDGDFGIAENLSKAKNTSVSSMEKSGLVAARAGKVRLIRPAELPAKWDPAGARTAWEILHHLIRVHDGQGEEATAALVKKLGNRVEFVPDLCLGLHRTCEQKKRATEALWYNSLGQSWHEICRLAQEVGEQPEPVVGQGSLEF
jgi:putative DNA methylase